MPRAKARSSDGLSIALKTPGGFFIPGSQVAGDVLLNTEDDFAIGSVLVELYGRVKVHFTQSHGQGESSWRGRAPLFSQEAVLYEGYHTHKPGAFSWPFQLRIPQAPDVTTVKEAKHQWGEKDHFLSTDTCVSAHKMPPTFKYRKWGFGYRFNVFIEYVVVATIKEAKGTSSVRLSTRKATVPLIVRDIERTAETSHTLPLNIEFRIPSPVELKSQSDASSTPTTSLHAETIRHTVKSSRLLLWSRNDITSSERTPALSFSDSIREKGKLVFNSGSLPRFTFDVTVSTPMELRILDERGIPFTISATPVTDGEKTTIPPERYPDIRVQNVSLSVKAKTYIRWKSILSERTTNTDSEIKLLDRYPVNQDLILYQGSLSRQDSQREEGTQDRRSRCEREEDSSSIDVLRLLGPVAVLRNYKTGLQTERPLPPTFHTYIITREYELFWRLELDVAGEKIKIESTQSRPITVLDPKMEDLEAFAKTADFLKGRQAENVENDDSDDESQGSDNATVASTGENTDNKSRLRRLLRRSKEAEAAEDAAVAHEEASNSSNGPPLVYRPGEILPRYEPGPSDFGYRHEIDEEPPSLTVADIPKNVLESVMEEEMVVC